MGLKSKRARYLLRRLYSRFRSIIRNFIGYPVIYNANKVNESDCNKRALLIYLVKPFLLKDDDPRFLNHQNLKQCKQIATVIGEFGYIVDVVDIGDKRFRSSKNYDLIISHRVNLSGIENLIRNNDLIKIYLSSGLNHIVSNRNLRKRYKLLFERRKRRLKIKRLVTEEMPYVLISNAIVGFGNEFTMNTWKEIYKGPTYSFNNYGFKETKSSVDSKDFSKARKNFLFFASGGNVLKGLNLLLEVFPKYPNLHLYVYGSFESESDFCVCYHKELYETPNIHPEGWVTVNSETFYDLLQKCTYIILPSCSEGQPGSVVQCMYSGLIPVVTKESGIDTENFGVTINDDGLEEIENTIVKLSKLPEDWHREHSIRTREVAEKRFNEDAFMDRWKEIIADILNEEAEQT